MKLLGLRDFLVALLHLSLVRKLPELIVQRHRLAPVGRRAVRVFLLQLLEGLLGLLVLKGVQQRDSLLDERLRLGRAAIWKFHFSQARLFGAGGRGDGSGGWQAPRRKAQHGQAE